MAGGRARDRPLPFATIDDETETGTETHGCSCSKKTNNNATMRFDDPDNVGPRQTGGIQFFGGVDDRSRKKQIRDANYWHNIQTAEDLLLVPLVYVVYRILRACFRRRQGLDARHRHHQRPSLWDRAQLSLGPTTVHLRYECTLLVCNALLTLAALVSIYRGGAGSWSDLHYLALSVLVMSRHVLIRWLCLNDVSTSSHPTVLGTLAKLLSTFCAAGQVFDSPPSSVLMTSDQHESGGYGTFRRGRTILMRAWYRRFMNTFGVPLRAVFRTFINPVLSKLLASAGVGRNNYQIASEAGDTAGKSSGGGTQPSRKKSGGGSKSTSNRSNSSSLDARDSSKDDPSLMSDPIAYIRSSTPELAHKLNIFRENYVPPTQKCVWLASLFFVAVGLFSFYRPKPGDGPTAGFLGAGGLFHDSGFLSQANPQNPGGNNPKQAKLVQQADSAASEYGGFGSLFGLGMPGARHMSGGPEGHDPPTIAAVVFHLSWIMTVASLLIFGRVFLPAPDLAVSASAQKAVRADMRHHGSGGGGGKHGSKSKHSESIPWAEQYYSINADNRFRLHCRIIFFRLIESVLLCVVVPHTEFACIATGHCSPNPYPWDLPGYLGVASSRNKIGGVPGSMYDDVVFDHVAAVVLAYTAAFITGAVLLSQVVALDRSCLATMGYMNEEYNKRPERGSGRSGGRNKDRRTTGNVVDGDPFGVSSFLKTTYSKLMWSLFRYEVGHQSTSQVQAYACVALLGCFGSNVLVLLAYFAAGKDLAALVLVVYATYRATGSMALAGTVDHAKMLSLASEIPAPLNLQKHPLAIPAEEASAITFKSN